MFDGSHQGETQQPGPVVRLRRDPECDRFDLNLTGSQVRVGLLTRPEQVVGDAELGDALLLQGLSPEALAEARVVVEGPGEDVRALFALDPELLDSADSLLPACWYLVPLQPECDELDDEEEPTEQDLEAPSTEPEQGYSLDVVDDDYDLGDLLDGEPDPDEESVSASELAQVTMPFPGLDPLASGFEPEQVIEQLRKQVAWEQHRREVAEAEVERLQEILQARSIEA